MERECPIYTELSVIICLNKGVIACAQLNVSLNVNVFYMLLNVILRDVDEKDRVYVSLEQ